MLTKEYSEKELIAFGNYLLSDTRKKLVDENENFTTAWNKVRSKEVSDADLCNWREGR
jgi:hypothetical protein